MTIAQAKMHLNVDADFIMDDAYIQELITVAEYVVANRCKVDSIEDLHENGKLPAPINHAVLLMIGNLYNNREAVSFGTAHELPMNFEYLLMPYVRY